MSKEVYVVCDEYYSEWIKFARVPTTGEWVLWHNKYRIVEKVIWEPVTNKVQIRLSSEDYSV